MTTCFLYICVLFELCYMLTLHCTWSRPVLLEESFWSYVSMENCSAARMFYNQKDLHAKSEMGRGHACGMKKDAKDECIEEYFGTLRTLWLVMDKSNYLANIVLHLFNINTWTWVSASSTVKGTEAVSRRSDKARVNTKMFLIIIIINRDISISTSQCILLSVFCLWIK